MVFYSRREKKATCVASERRVPQVVAVTGGRRGVGKSTVVAGLARLLAGAGCEVLVAATPADAGSLGELLGLQAELRRARRTRPATLPLRVARGETGLSLLILDQREVGAVSAVQAYALQLEEMDGYRRHLDVVLLDCGAETPADNLFLSGLAQEVVVVTTTDPRAVEEARTFMARVAESGLARNFRLLVNGTTRPEQVRKVYAEVVSSPDFSLRAGLDLLGGLPFQERFQVAWEQTTLAELATHFEPLLAGLFSRSWAFSGGPGGGLQMFWRSLLFCQDCPAPVCRTEEPERPPFSLDGCPVQRFVTG